MNRLSGLFHKKIYLLWNRPESLLLTRVQDISMNQLFSEVTKLTLKRAYDNSELFNSSLY